jgi:hypothetical protein
MRFSSEYPKGRNHFRDSGIGVRIILNCIWDKDEMEI